MNQDEPKPWELEPSLQQERLRALGEFLLRTHNECVELHDRDNGDGAWSLGCRIYQRVCNRLLKQSASGLWPWLKVRSGRNDLELLVMIGSCPVRYFRGEARNPTNLQLFRAEEMQRWLGKEFADPDGAFNWFIVVERDAAGRAVQVVVEQANSDGETRFPWIAATTKSKRASRAVASMGKAPVDVGPPVIAPIVHDERNRGQKQ